MTWPPVYTLKRHRRAKSVRLHAREGLHITVPYRFNLREIPAILEEHRAWIEKHLALILVQQKEPLPEYIELKIYEETWRVIYEKSPSKIRLLERAHLKEILILGDINNENLCRQKLVMWLKQKAKMILPMLLTKTSEQMQVNFKKISIRNQKTLWGSCTHDKSINLNYKLIFLPYSLALHVLIHELAHTIHLNHSARFWKLVEKFDPQWKTHHKQLRHGDEFIPKWIKGEK